MALKNEAVDNEHAISVCTALVVMHARMQPNLLTDHTQAPYSAKKWAQVVDANEREDGLSAYSRAEAMKSWIVRAALRFLQNTHLPITLQQAPA